MPSDCSAAGAVNWHQWQPMGKRHRCHQSSANGAAASSPKEGIQLPPQSCIAPTKLRQRGAKPVAIKLLKTSDSKKDHLHGTALLYQELYSHLFDESHTLKAICPGL